MGASTEVPNRLSPRQSEVGPSAGVSEERCDKKRTVHGADAAVFEQEAAQDRPTLEHNGAARCLPGPVGPRGDLFPFSAENRLLIAQSFGCQAPSPALSF
jgi:hypothetical protein